MQVIYADILFVLNLYVTYALLLLTSVITKSRAERMRLLLSSVLSGIYSMIILVPDISENLIAISRVPASVVILLIAFRCCNMRHFFKLSVGFFAVNLIFAGLMFFLWYFISPQNMYFNNGIIYFNISAANLVVLTAVCYFALKLIHKILSFKVPSNSVYDLHIYFGEKVIFCKSFLDTGNNLKDPFSGYPVIIVNQEKVKDIISPNIISESTFEQGKVKIRFIVCNTVSGEGVLSAFVPDKVVISSLNRNFETEKVVVAVSERKLKNGEFDAVLPYDLLSI